MLLASCSIIQQNPISVKTFFVKKFTSIAGILGSGRKTGFWSESPAILLEDETMGVVGWFQVFLLSESGFSGLKDYADKIVGIGIFRIQRLAGLKAGERLPRSLPKSP